MKIFDQNTNRQAVAPRAAKAWSDDRGAVMIMGLFMAMSMIGVLWFTMGVGKMLLSRERAQDAADTMAHGVALVQARGMNLIAAYNIIVLGLVFLHLVTRLGQAIMFFILQAIGLPENGFDGYETTQYLEQANKRCSQFSGSGATQDPSNPAHDSTRDILLTIPYSASDWPSLRNSAWTCANKPAIVSERPLNADGTEVRGRLEWYNDKTGLNLPSGLPSQIVENHNKLRHWDLRAEDAFASIFRAIQDEQKRIRDDYAWQVNEGAVGAIVQRYNGAGALPNMRISGQSALGTGAGSTLPVSFQENYATLQELCVDLVTLQAWITMKAGVSEGGENMWATTRAFGPILRKTDDLFGVGLDINGVFSATTNGTFARQWYCDNLSAGASGGLNYWTNANYHYPVVDPSVQNGAPALRVWSDVGNQFTDQSMAKVSIPSRQIVTGGDSSYRSYASAETYFACDSAWTNPRCNGIPGSGGNTANRQGGTFRTNWAARLVRVNSPGAPLGGADVLH